MEYPPYGIKISLPPSREAGIFHATIIRNMEYHIGVIFHTAKKQTVFKPHGPNKKSGNWPKTTAKPLNQHRKDLTLSNGLEVIAYVESHQDKTQKEAVVYFKAWKSGVLSFTQGALSKILKKCGEMQEHTAANPSKVQTDLEFKKLAAWEVEVHRVRFLPNRLIRRCGAGNGDPNQPRVMFMILCYKESLKIQLAMDMGGEDLSI
ncbi:hypothetical protein BT96DRAFT_1083805 [Gymnopus androsaceus JB14]|uniref:Uncharacterized protein n=1 Tax=Gymnopus androsaceus JB14 TaxID=1447944 RepID=A0A6A4I0H8_9AGAR|nr:hypothetical protein BT96DRAFT_1083805 [Gymnopus androsaceus JB14]